MATYFHLCKTKLGAGSIIEPGNFGEIIRLHGYKHAGYQREMLLEDARTQIAPLAPSRLDSLFAFPREQDARHFQMREFVGFGTDFLYEIEPLSDECPYVAQMSAIDNWNVGDQNVKAELYWNKRHTPVDRPVVVAPSVGMLTGSQEILLRGSVRVIRNLGRIVT